MTEKVQDEFSDYDDFIKDMDRDDRVGYHDFMVTGVTDSSHTKVDDGNTFKKVDGVLIDISNKPKIDFILTRLPSKDELEVIKAGDSGRAKAVGQNLKFQTTLKRVYGFTAETLKAGDTFRVNIIKNKEGFVRLVAILEPGAVQAGKVEKAARPVNPDAPPF